MANDDAVDVPGKARWGCVTGLEAQVGTLNLGLQCCDMCNRTEISLEDNSRDRRAGVGTFKALGIMYMLNSVSEGLS